MLLYIKSDFKKKITFEYEELAHKMWTEKINGKELTDIKNSLDNSFDSDYNKLLYGIDKMREIDFTKLDNPDDMNYLEGMVSIYTSLNRLENFIIDLREVHIQISQNFRYIASELPLKENNSSDEVLLEDDEKDDDEEVFWYFIKGPLGPFHFFQKRV